MKNYIHTLWESTDPSLSAHISISYFSLTPTNSPRILSELLIHAGNLDVSIALRPEEKLSRTLRDILIALHLFPYISKKIAAFVLLHDSLTALDFSSFHLPLKKVGKETFLNSLMESACRSMASIELFGHGARLSIPAFFDPSHIAVALYLNMLRYYDKLGISVSGQLTGNPLSSRYPDSSIGITTRTIDKVRQ